MLIPKPLTERFKGLYAQLFNERLSDEEAQKQGLAIIRIVAIKELLKNEEKKNAK